MTALAVVIATGIGNAAPKPSIDEVLRSNAYFVVTRSGIVAKQIDGTSAPLVQGKIGAVAYDSDLELIWFVDGAALRVLDLRAPRTPPVTIGQGIPADVKIMIEDAPDSGSAESRGPMGAHVTLSWAQRTLEFGDTPFGSDPEKKAPATIKLVGQKWLAAQDARKARARRVDVVGVDPKPGKHPLPKGATCKSSDTDDSWCGLPTRFGATGWTLYITDRPCHRFCEPTCVAANASGKLAVPPAMLPVTPTMTSGPCGDYLLDATGANWLLSELIGRGRLCTKAGCIELEGIALGWRDPGTTVTTRFY